MLYRKSKKSIAILLLAMMMAGVMLLGALAENVLYVNVNLGIVATRDGVDEENITVTFVAQGSENVVYTLADGDLEKTDDGKYRFKYIPEDPALPAGMLTFRGWYQGTDAQPFDFEPIEDDLLLVARFADTYLITFKDMPGSSSQVKVTQELSPGTPIVLPDEAKKAADERAPEGSHVAYWYIEGGDETERFIFGTPATGDLTLVPKYADSYFVLFVSAGTQLTNPVQMVAAGSTAERPEEVLTRMGYDFLHWSKTENGTEPFAFGTPINEDTVLYAVWQGQEVEYQVAIWMEKPDFSGTPNYIQGIDDYNYVTTVTMKGIAGEQTNITGTEPEIKALFEGVDPLLRFGEVQGTIQKEILGTGLTVVNLFATRKIYTFIFNLGGRTTDTMTMHLPGGDVTYTGGSTDRFVLKLKYEQFIADKFPLQGVDECVTFGGPYILSTWKPDPAQIHAEAGNGNIGTKHSFLDTSLLSRDGQTLSYTLTANWSANAVPISYRFFVEAYPGQATPKETTIRVPALKPEADFVLMPEYSQVWISGSPMGTQKEIQGTIRATLGNSKIYMVRYNYSDEDGWYLYSNPDNYTDGYYCFFYYRNVWDFSYELMLPAGSPVQGDFSDKPMMFDEPLRNATPAVPSCEGYAFKGWFTDANYQKELDFDTTTERMPNGPMRVYAKWESTEHVVEYFDYFGSATPVSAEGVGKGENITQSPYAPGVGYEGKGQFIRWQTVEPHTGILIPFYQSTPVFRDYKLYATWKTTGFTLTYHKGAGQGTPPEDGNIYDISTQARVKDSNGLAKEPDEVFYAWKDDNEKLYYPGSLISFWSDVNLTAQYARREELVTVTYIPNHAASPDTDLTIEAKKNTNIQLEGKIFTATDGYELIGWSDKADNQGIVTYPLNSVYTLENSETTFYGVWEFVGYTVTFRAGDWGYFAPPNTEKVVFDAIEFNTPWDTGWVPTAVAAGNYYFTGWDKPFPAAVTEDLEFVAQYALRTVIEITAGSASQEYDGTELTSGVATVTSAVQLKAGDQLENVVMAAGSRRTNAGTTANLIASYQIMRGNVDVTHEYRVLTLPGTLTVTPKPVTITVANGAKEYGDADPAFTATPTGYVGTELDGIEIRVVRTNAGVQAIGSYPGVLTTERVVEEWDAAYPNYLFTVIPGNFEIVAKPIAQYTIEYYFQNLAQNGYERDAAYPAAVRTGSADTATAPLVAADYVSRSGFTFDTANANNVLSAIINRDGTTVLRLYYNRNVYTVSYYYTNTTVPAGATALPATRSYVFGASVTVAANASAPQYTFSGWSPNRAGTTFTMPANNVSLRGTFTAVSTESAQATLTIYYQYTNGATAAPTVSEVYPVGTGFAVTSPVITGYKASMLSVTGTMTANGAVYTVIYSANLERSQNHPNYDIFEEEDIPLAGASSRNVGDCAE